MSYLIILLEFSDFGINLNELFSHALNNGVLYFGPIKCSQVFQFTLQLLHFHLLLSLDVQCWCKHRLHLSLKRLTELETDLPRRVHYLNQLLHVELGIGDGAILSLRLVGVLDGICDGEFVIVNFVAQLGLQGLSGSVYIRPKRAYFSHHCQQILLDHISQGHQSCLKSISLTHKNLHMCQLNLLNILVMGEEV